MADNKENIRARLKEAREYFGLQSKDFAEKVGLAQGNYSAIEAGTRSIGDKVLNKIASKLSINIKWLLTGEGEMLNTSDHPPIEIEPVSGGEINVSQLMNMMQKQMDMVNSVMEQNRQLVETNAKLMQELMKLGKEERPAIEDFGSVEDRQ